MTLHGLKPHLAFACAFLLQAGHSAAAPGLPPSLGSLCQRVAALKAAAAAEFAAEKDGDAVTGPDGLPTWAVKGLPHLAPDSTSGEWRGCFIVDTKAYIARNCILSEAENLSEAERDAAMLERARQTASCLGLDRDSVRKTDGGWYRVSPDSRKPFPRVVFAYSSQPGAYLYMLMNMRSE